MMEQNPWIDISVPLRNGMVRWPNDPPIRIEKTGDCTNVIVKKNVGIVEESE